MSNQIFNVLIIGAGAIGAQYDAPDSKHFLTHAHAFTAHPGFNLLGFVDSNQEQAEKAAMLWNCRTFNNLEEAFEKEKVDIVSVAVPDELHYELLKKIAELPLRAVFAEKPLTKTILEAEEILTIYRNRSIPICVNYRRSFVPEFEVLREKIRGKTFGKYLTGTGYYGKGFLHNGSHMIHLLHYLIGEIMGHRIISIENDFYIDDPSISAEIIFGDNQYFSLQHINCTNYTIFEADFLFEFGRVRITDTGFKIEYHTRNEHDIFRGYTVLTKSEDIDTKLGVSLLSSVDNIYNHLTGAEPLKCSVYDAFKTMQACNNIANN